MPELPIPTQTLGRDQGLVRRWLALRFVRYTALSLVTVPGAYVLLTVCRLAWDINAGVLNVLVGTVLTPPSYWLHRAMVWPEGSGRSTAVEMFDFWKAVMASTFASSLTMALLDALSDLGVVLVFAVGLAVQGVVFVVRFFWFDQVTFARPPV